MAKQQKIISMDTELATQLSNLPNGSKVVCDLLKAYFGEADNLKKETLQLKIDMKQVEFDKIKTELDDMKKVLSGIISEEDKINALNNKLPERMRSIIFRNPNMNKRTLRQQYDTMTTVPLGHYATYEECERAYIQENGDKNFK